MKAVKGFFLLLLFLAIAIAILWAVLSYRVWPKHEIAALMPAVPLGYMASSNLDETISEIEDSEFVDRVARSPLWARFKASGLWQRIEQEKHAWERQTGMALRPREFMPLVENNAILAFYGGSRPAAILLISELDVLTRWNVNSGGTKQMLASSYDFTTEIYEGTQLMTLGVPKLKFFYCFIGRIGLLSTDKSLLKEAVDLHNGTGQEAGAVSKISGLTMDMPESEISIYIDVEQIMGNSDMLKAPPLRIDVKNDPRLRFALPVAEQVNAWAVSASRYYGDLTFHQSILYNAGDSSNAPVTPANSMVSDNLPAPDDSMLFASYSSLDLAYILNAMEGILGLKTAARSELLSAVRKGAAVVILEPNIKELQLIPPAAVFVPLKDRAMAQAALDSFKNSTKVGSRQLEFTEEDYEGVPINYTSLPIGMGMSLDAGYGIVRDDLLVMASDVSALKAAIDVAVGKRKSLMEGKDYADVVQPISNASGNELFLNIGSAAAVTKQAARLYAWRAQIAEKKTAERLSTMLYENVFVLEAWDYLGAVFDVNDGKANMKIVLSSGRE